MASKLPYEEAFSKQKLPPVPSSLSASIDAMVRAHAAARPSPAAANDQLALETASGSSDTTPIRSRLRSTPAWLGAAFAAGIACCAVAMTWFPLAGGVGEAINGPSPAVAAWVQAAAGYQQLYARETVAPLVPDTDASARTVAAIRQDDKLAVEVPDLRADGLEFKRVQRLRFHGRPLVQIVYLPKEGAPIALCVMAQSRPPTDHVVGQEIAGMNVVTWNKGALGYALIGSQQGVDLTALAKRIAADHVDKLFAAVQAAVSVDLAATGASVVLPAVQS
jgi:hypothetical protein